MISPTEPCFKIFISCFNFSLENYVKKTIKGKKVTFKFFTPEKQGFLSVNEQQQKIDTIEHVKYFKFFIVITLSLEALVRLFLYTLWVSEMPNYAPRI